MQGIWLMFPPQNFGIEASLDNRFLLKLGLVIVTWKHSSYISRETILLLHDTVSGLFYPGTLSCLVDLNWPPRSSTNPQPPVNLNAASTKFKRIYVKWLWKLGMCQYNLGSYLADVLLQKIPFLYILRFTIFFFFKTNLT